MSGMVRMTLSALAAVALATAIMLVAALALDGCAHSVTPSRVPPEGIDAATADPPSACFAYCQRLADTACPEARVSVRGEDCLALCTRIETSGQVALPLACVADAGSLDAIRACGVRCILSDGGSP